MSRAPPDSVLADRASASPATGPQPRRLVGTSAWLRRLVATWVGITLLAVGSSAFAADGLEETSSESIESDALPSAVEKGLASSRFDSWTVHERSRVRTDSHDELYKLRVQAYSGGHLSALYFDGDGELVAEEPIHYGYWSLLPPLIAIVLAFWFQEVVTALFVGVALGGVVTGDINIIDAYILPAISDNAEILLYLASLGGLIGLWNRTGGARYFAESVGEWVVRGRRSAKFFAWIMGIIFHQGGQVSTLLTGTTARPLGDRHDVSHEELAYMVDSTASPAATLIPFNPWPIYISGLVAGTIPIIENEQQALQFFIQSLPYNFYAIFALLITFLFAWELLPWVPGQQMRDAMSRARDTGELDADNATPLTSSELTDVDVPADFDPGLADFLVPLVTLLGVAIVPYVVSYFVLGHTEDPTLLIGEAFGLALLSAVAVALVKGLSLDETIDGFIDGCKGMTIGVVILYLALTLKEVGGAVGTADFVVGAVGGALGAAVLPALLLVLCLVIAFSTGTSWGTYAVMFPVALPLAWSISQDPLFISLCFGAVTGGSVFGDQCSPISDTTILSSLTTGCDLMDHVYTQLPLAILAAGLASVAYTVIVVLFV